EYLVPVRQPVERKGGVVILQKHRLLYFERDFKDYPEQAVARSRIVHLLGVSLGVDYFYLALRVDPLHFNDYRAELSKAVGTQRRIFGPGARDRARGRVTYFRRYDSLHGVLAQRVAHVEHVHVRAYRDRTRFNVHADIVEVLHEHLCAGGGEAGGH